MFETRTINAQFNTREEEQDLFIEAYFSVFGGRYELWDKMFETVDHGAFHLERDTDVRALCDHETRIVLGRTTAGTLVLSVDEHGLFGRVKINREDQDAMNLYARVKRGDVSQCSFGFEILGEHEEVVNGETIIHLTDVKLWEVSVVTFPAYKDTVAYVRKEDFESKKQRKLEAWRSAMLEKLEGIKC